MRLHGIDGNKVRFFAFCDHTALLFHQAVSLFCSHGNDLSCRHDSRIALGNAVFYVHHRTEDLHFIPKT